MTRDHHKDSSIHKFDAKQLGSLREVYSTAGFTFINDGLSDVRMCGIQTRSISYFHFRELTSTVHTLGYPTFYRHQGSLFNFQRVASQRLVKTLCIPVV